MPSPEDVQIGLMELELEQAWAVMRHHEQAAESSGKDYRRVLCSLNLASPKLQSFIRISQSMAALDAKTITTEAFVERVRLSIQKANHESFLVEEAQARAKKAKGTQ